MVKVIEIDGTQIEKTFELCQQMAIDMKIAGYDDVDEPWARKNLRNIIINPHYKIFVAQKDFEWVGFIIVRIDPKLWNKTTVGELVLLWTRKDVRHGDSVSDALMDRAKAWFKECECHYFQTSVLMFDENYENRTDVTEKARKYWNRYGMNEVGYNFVQKIEYEESFFLDQEELEDY